jgi:hypothetical protein
MTKKTIAARVTKLESDVAALQLGMVGVGTLLQSLGQGIGAMGAEFAALQQMRGALGEMMAAQQAVLPQLSAALDELKGRPVPPKPTLKVVAGTDAEPPAAS